MKKERINAFLRALEKQGPQTALFRWGGKTVALPIRDIIWGEVVDDKVFLYTAAEMYQTALGLGMLESRWEHLGLFRCAKSTVINLNAVRSLRSRPGGRIEALLPTGEKILISRRYAPALREKLQGGYEGRKRICASIAGPCR